MGPKGSVTHPVGVYVNALRNVRTPLKANHLRVNEKSITCKLIVLGQVPANRGRTIGENSLKY